MSLCFLVCLTLLHASTPSALDNDTLQQENARFPSALEVVTGNYPRHSDPFFEWRVADRNMALVTNAISAEAFDDLAIAHSKLGRTARAVELMELKEKRYPGLYTTAANTGTFHIHAGDLELGLEHLERALLINPNAHFGREVYQTLLAKYLVEVRGTGGALTLPVCKTEIDPDSSPTSGFWSFIREERKIQPETAEKEIRLAVRGMMGIMRFGSYDSPILLEALSDLLIADVNHDAKRLATRALLKASYGVDEEAQREAYRSKARAVIAKQTSDLNNSVSMDLAEIESAFGAELAIANASWSKLYNNELKWIADGEDVDARFADAYDEGTYRTRISSEARERTMRKYGKIAAGLLALIATAFLVALPKRSKA